MTGAAPLFSQDSTPEGVAYLVVDLCQKTIFFSKNSHNKQNQHIYVPIDNRLSSLALFRLQNYVNFFLHDLEKNAYFSKNSTPEFTEKGKTILQSISQTCTKFSSTQEYLDEIVPADEAVRMLSVTECWPASAGSFADAREHIENIMGASGKKIVGNLEHALYGKLADAAKNGIRLSESQNNFLVIQNRRESISPFHQVPRPYPQKRKHKDEDEDGYASS